MRFILSLLSVLSTAGCSSEVVQKQSTLIKAPFINGRFENLEPFPDKSFWQVLQWRFFEPRKTWPKWVETPQYKVDIERSEALRWTVINHATVLIQMNGLNILTDPIFSDRTSPVSFAGPQRVRSPGVSFESLPPIDIVLVSHNHYDHLDLPTLKMLNDRFRPRFFVGLGNGPLLETAQIQQVTEMDWWDEIQIQALQIQFVPAQHWSARGLFDRRKTLWGGFYLKGKKTVYFAGDTGYGSFFNTLQTKLGTPDLAFIPIGAYAPRWFMKYAHLNPEDAVNAALDLKAKKSVGIHFGTFQLTDEGIEDPAAELAAVIQEKNLSQNFFLVPEFGKSTTEVDQ